MIKSFLKNRDVFGYSVQLSLLDGKNKTQNTVLGGVVTMLIYAFSLTYFAIKFQKMLGGQLDNMQQTNFATKYDEV